MFLPPVPLGLEESPRSVNSLWGGAVNHSGGRGQLPAPSFPSCCQIQMPVAFCLAALATPRDRSRPEAGVGWEQPREVHASLFLPLPFAHFSLLFVNISSLLRRLVTLISQQATLLASNEAFKKQAESASEAAKKYMEENDQLKKVGLAFPNCPSPMRHSLWATVATVSLSGWEMCDTAVVGKMEELGEWAEASEGLRKGAPLLLSPLPTASRPDSSLVKLMTP